MNGIALNLTILRENLDFIRGEITRITAVKKQLESNPRAKSDDAVRLLKSYGEILSNLKYLLQCEYDAEGL